MSPKGELYFEKLLDPMGVHFRSSAVNTDKVWKPFIEVMYAMLNLGALR